MDSQKEISRLPILAFPLVGIVFSCLAMASFFLVQLHDSPIEEEIVSFYEAHLLAQEKSLFIDFYEKRLSIDQQGSISHLAKIQTAAQAENPKRFISHLISDRGFRDYLEQKAPLYFLDETSAKWSHSNQTLKTKLDSRLTQQLSITPEQFRTQPRFSSLFTQPFIETSLLNLLSNCILALLSFALLEKNVRRSRLLLFLLAATFSSGILFITAGNMITPPLNGLNLLVYLSMSLLIGLNLSKFKQFTQKAYRFSALLFIIMLCKVGLDSYFSYLSQIESLILAVLIMPTVVLGWRFTAWFELNNTPSLPVKTRPEELSPESRKAYADAMAAISRFNFNYARKELQALLIKHSNVKMIRESAYHLEKLHPNDEHFWPLAQACIEDALKEQNFTQMRAIFSDIQKAAPKREQAKQQIAPEYYLKMLVVFTTHGDLDTAEKAFMFLELAGDTDLVIDACRLLIESYASKKMPSKADRYAALLATYQP